MEPTRASGVSGGSSADGRPGWRPAAGRSPLRGATSITSLLNQYAMAAGIPLLAGLALYGWRAAATVGLLVGSTAGAAAVWQRIGRRGRQLRMRHCLWLAMLLGLMLPGHLASREVLAPLSPYRPWPLIPAAALSLVIMTWMLGGPGSGRVNPVLTTWLLLFVLFAPMLAAHRVLPLGRLFTGDIMDAPTPDPSSPAPAANKTPWYAIHAPAAAPMYLEPAAERLLGYTTAVQREWAPRSVQVLLRDEMPPLENLIVGGDPGPIGSSSAMAVIIGGLFLLYRGLIDYKIPLLIVAAAFVTLLILPIPVFINEQGPQWHWLAFRGGYLTLPAAITFVNYELVGSPLLFTSFFLATSAAVRPMTRRGRVVYALATGVLAAALQL
jgi:Na+-translocating ferredoxin:NAD+ oxidoreductase RnfD subunit